MAGRATTAALRSRSVDGAVELGGTDPQAKLAERPDVVVCASGNLANVYFTVLQERMTATQVEAGYPGLLAGLIGHPGIGFIMVRADEGTLVIGARGVHHLDDDRIEGEDPLALFGERAADHMRRLDAFSNVGDLLINSTFDPELEEVAAFEELVGSHGGMGGPQTRPFLLHPADLVLDDDPLVGAPAVHQQLQRWARQLDVNAPIAYAEPRAALGEPTGLRWAAGWMAFMGSLELALAALVAVAMIAGEREAVDLALGVAPVLVALVVTVIGLASLAAGYGIWRRRRWAWMVALALSTLNVLQVLLGMAREGLSGIVSYGALSAIVSLVLFWYLTRPHVTAAFGRARVTRKRSA
jgi:hypothetical protein